MAQFWSAGREDDNAVTPLLEASMTGDVALVAKLLARGDEVVYHNRFFGETPCEQALEHGHVGVAELLLAAVLEHPEWREQATELFWRQLVLAAMRSRELSVLAFVLSYEPDLNSAIRRSEKPLFDAVRRNNAEMTKVLIAHGADASGRDLVGSTLLHIAAKYNALDVLRVLEKSSVSAEINTPDAQGNTALHYAADCVELELAATLLKMGADTNLTNRWGSAPLHLAVDKARLDVIQLLVDDGHADADKSDLQGNTPLLLLAASNPDVDEYPSDSEDEERESKTAPLQIAKLLLQQGADVNAANRTSATPLHYAMRRLDTELMDVLLANGADVNKRNRFGDSPLHQAARLALIPPIWEKLLAHGADPKALDSSGKTPEELIPNDVLRVSVQAVISSSKTVVTALSMGSAKG